MPNFIIDWDGGGEVAAMIIDADTQDEALEYAHTKWLQAVEKQAYPAYRAQPYSEDRAEELGLQTLL